MRYAQLVMGPAGSGKSTYCSTVAKHCATIGRMIQFVNLDPAAEQFDYPVTVDVRELIALEDVMEAEDLKLGPNGGLIFCMEYLAQNFDWLEEQLGSTEDDYVIFDCPGQIELYSHIPVMKRLVETLQQWDFRICSVFLIDSQFLIDCSKFFSGVLCALAAMVQLELPHVNIMTKMDLLTKKQAREVERYLQPDAQLLLDDLNPAINNKFKKLNEALAQLIDDYSLVAFLPLNIKDEDSVSDVLVQIDNTIQYGEDLDVREARELDQEDESEEES